LFMAERKNRGDELNERQGTCEYVIVQ
jgi:hypothetical protein